MTDGALHAPHAPDDWDEEDWFWFVELLDTALRGRLLYSKVEKLADDTPAVNEGLDLLCMLAPFHQWYLDQGLDAKARVAVLQEKLTAMGVSDFSQVHGAGNEPPIVNAVELLRRATRVGDLFITASLLGDPPTNDIERAQALRTLRDLRKRGIQIKPDWE
jgi:hypothetical protein